MNIYRMIEISFPLALAACSGPPIDGPMPDAGPDDAPTIVPDAPCTIPADAPTFDAPAQIPFDSGLVQCPTVCAPPYTRYCVGHAGQLAVLECLNGSEVLLSCLDSANASFCKILCADPATWCSL